MKTKQIRLLDLAVVLFYLHQAVVRWGIEDADRTLNELTYLLDRRAAVPTDVLESALAALNQWMEAGGGFEYPGGAVTYPELLKRLASSDEVYDKFYQMFVRRENDVVREDWRP